MGEEQEYYSDDFGGMKEWTIMVYLGADNILSANAIAILQDLEAIADHPGVRVLACYDPNTPLPKGARYLEIHKQRQLGRAKPPFNWGLHNDMITPGHIVVGPDLCNGDPAKIAKSADEPPAKEGLRRFLSFALRDCYPSKHRMLILFGHGSLVAGNTFLADTSPPSFLRLGDFATIIKHHFGRTGSRKPRLDILAFDNCVMNGIEAAYEIKDHVDYMIGSQDLMLALGWPFRKIIKTVQKCVPRHPSEGKPLNPKAVCREIIKACARNLIDFSLMERSSEQAVCDLTKLRDYQLVGEIKKLARLLTEGALAVDDCGRVKYPLIRDAIRLARLEAQSFSDENFVDLYDFCELLLQKCSSLFHQEIDMAIEAIDFYDRTKKEALSLKLALSTANFTFNIAVAHDLLANGTNVGRLAKEIAYRCKKILETFRGPRDNSSSAWENGVVPYSYYVCPNLQYSHGLSIYFPWVMPEQPIIFEPIKFGAGCEPVDYELRTAFDEYRRYAFAKDVAWADFLIQFFKATLRNVRVADYEYEAPDDKQDKEYDLKELLVARAFAEPVAPPTDLQKTSSDTGEDDNGAAVRIKNYPRRFYLSPQDCLYREDREYVPDCDGAPQYEQNRRVSYLGWNIRGIVAEVIDYHPVEPKPCTSEHETK